MLQLRSRWHVVDFKSTPNKLCALHNALIRNCHASALPASPITASFTTSTQHDASVVTPRRLDSTCAPALLRQLDTLIFDQDGVLWRGQDLIPNAVEVGHQYVGATTTEVDQSQRLFVKQPTGVSAINYLCVSPARLAHKCDASIHPIHPATVAAQ